MEYMLWEIAIKKNENTDYLKMGSIVRRLMKKWSFFERDSKKKDKCTKI